MMWENVIGLILTVVFFGLILFVAISIPICVLKIIWKILTW